MHDLWYAPDIQGSVWKLRDTYVTAWASEPDRPRGLVYASFYGNSTAIKAVMAKLKVDGSTGLESNKIHYTLIASTYYEYTKIPSKPIVMPDGNVAQAILRKESSDNEYLCYVADEKENYRMYDLIKLITDYPVHISWIPYLRERAFYLGLWGVCNEDRSASLHKQRPMSSLTPSIFGIQMRWLRNSRERWEGMITSAIKNNQIKLPEV